MVFDEHALVQAEAYGGGFCGLGDDIIIGSAHRAAGGQ